MKKQEVLVIFLTIILVFSVFIIAAAEDNSEVTEADEEVLQENGEENSGEEEEIISMIESPTNVNDLLNFFERLQGNWKVYEEDELVQDSTVSYEYLSKEIVMGEEADKISIRLDEISGGEMLMYFWVGEEEILQIEMDGQIFPKQMVEMMKEDLLSSVFAPFTMYKEFDIEKLKENGKTSRISEKFGEEELDIIKIEGEDIADMNLKSGMIKLADFDDFLIVVEYKYLSIEEKNEVDYIVEDIKMR